MNLNKVYIISLILFGYCIPSNCTDSDACNYNPDAINDDGSCYYPLDDCDENFLDCCPPIGFGHAPQTNQLSLGIQNAYKFNSENSLDIFEDWIVKTDIQRQRETVRKRLCVRVHPQIWV